MPVTLGALLAQPALGLTVLACGEMAGQEVRWVHASELADPTPYLEGGELLLSVGMWFEAGALDGVATAYVQRLIDAGVAGLGFGVGIQHAMVPDELVVAAAERGLPLLQVPEKTPFITISRTVWEALAADQYAEVTRIAQAQQELTRAAVAAGPAGLVRRIAERLDGWALLLDAAGTVEHAFPAGAARRGGWLATELERFRDLSTPVSATLSVDGDQIVVQSLRIGRRNGGFLAVGSTQRLGQEQRNVLNTAVSLLTLMLAQSTALQTAESHLRTTIFDLLVSGDAERAAKLADDLWGGLPREPVRLLLVAGEPRCRDDLSEIVAAAAATAGERVFRAEVGERLAIVHSAGGRMRQRVLTAAAASEELVVGESSEATIVELHRASREAEQALEAGQRTGRGYTAFADIGAAGLLSLLATPSAVAFAESLLRPLIEHDATGRGDLLRSLGTWLEHNAEWDAAAAALGVHRHTLRHRIRRVETLLARDLGLTAVRVELWAGIRLLAASRVPGD
ncbi:PucR family transcriptional regulator [Pseudonocardia sp. TRM90224]|uniref:PucR family transcriptional regulator n=1 Tax=Pseudonocardia sp. TRM90224 TaxID=2812678 RepID=UPI001E3ADFAB|nr:PucR family transcriptional regulator ligand-binding domain-containing protein [Pseudonocardia sp. TRM90224]